METIPDHHVFKGFCRNRPKYRDGKIQRAVKVFTINLESKYLIVQNMPDLNVFDELIKLFELFGTVVEKRILQDYPKVEKFNRAVLIKFKNIQHSRLAKRKMDNFSFMGNVLHVFYAPEYESVDETREKLSLRRIEVANRLKLFEKQKTHNSTCKLLEKSKRISRRPTKTLEKDIFATSVPSTSNANRMPTADISCKKKVTSKHILEQGKWQALNSKRNEIAACSSNSTPVLSKFNLNSLLRVAEKKERLKRPITETIVSNDQKSEESLIIRQSDHPRKRLKLVPRNFGKQVL